MPLFRHHALLLAQQELTDTGIVGPTFRVRPSDGDGLFDRDQHWFVMFDLLREGDGLVSAQLSTSFDGVLWHPVTGVNTKRAVQVVEFVELPAFVPLVRVETQVSLGGVSLLHRIVARLASDGPFTLQPV